MISQIDTLLDYNEAELYTTLGRALAEHSLGMAPETDEELQADGELWFSRHRKQVLDLVCSSRTVQTYLSSEKAKNRVLIVASIADLVSSLIWGFGAFAVAVLLIREGLENICEIKQAPAIP